jgi:putative tryptophan/tyrosine transport system substrate-binding protein
MTRRWQILSLLLALVVAMFFLASPAGAQSVAKSHRIGWLGHGAPPSAADRNAGDFQQALRDLGYVEGPNFVIEYRYANGNVEKLPELAAELVKLKVDVIVTSGEPAALAAKRATNSIPIVAVEYGMDPVKAGIVASLARPEANVTGLATQNEELWQKRLAVFKQIVPKVSRVAVLWNPVNPGNASCVQEIKAAAPPMGLQVSLQEVRDTNALERAFAGVAKERPDALVICWDSVTLGQARRIGDFALQQRLPTLAAIKEYVEAGGLMSLGMSLQAHRRRSAYYVDKVLKGAKPGALPVERPLQFDLVINVATAKALGLAPPSTVLVLADDLIQ